MPYGLRAGLVCALTALLAAGCGETADGPPGDGGTGGTAGTAGTAGVAGGSGGSGGSGGLGGVGGVAGTGGTGGVVGLCAGVDCSDQNDCTIDATCNPDTGGCEGGRDEAADTPCGDGSYVCDGRGRCVGCNRAEQCPDDGNECTNPFCDNGGCVNVQAGGSCTYMGGAGVRQGETCVNANRCEPYPCENRGACVVDECNAANGTCSYTNRPIDTRCLGSGGRFCDGAGRCVACNESAQCDDGNECTSDTCVTGIIPQCLTLSLEDGSNCEGSATACIAGQCQADPLDRQTFSGNKDGIPAGMWNWWPARNWLPYEFYPYGLAGFYFNFTGSGVDHELEQIQSGFFLDDYLPSPGMETAGWALYEDQNGDDPYNWEIDAQRLPVGSTQHQFGECTEWSAIFNKAIGQAPSGYTAVLLGFNLDRETDYNVEHIRVRLYKSGTTLYFDMYYTDDGGAHPTCYSVRYAWVPVHRVRTWDDSLSTSAGDDDAQPINAQRPILQGFDIQFTNGDHHVDEVGIQVVPGEVRVWLNDQNDDDPFSWRVWWADLE